MRPCILSALYLSAAVVLFQACQPGALTRKSEPVQVDSSLYFQPVQVKDAFMDSLYDPAGQAVSLSMKVIPLAAAEPEQPRFKEVEGYRVQIFAGLDSLSAAINAAQSRQVTADSVYTCKEAQLYKVQIGDYIYRYQADSARMHLRKSGYPGAWVVKRAVLLPLPPNPAGIKGGAAVASPPADSTAAEATGPEYKIQMLATASIERAQQLVQDLTAKYKFPAFYEKSGSMVKVLVGPYATEAEARRILVAVRKSGFPDAWLVH
jgi:hypothetical protein